MQRGRWVGLVVNMCRMPFILCVSVCARGRRALTLGRTLHHLVEACFPASRYIKRGCRLSYISCCGLPLRGALLAFCGRRQ